MKRNDWIYILGIAAYSFLFYEQSAGLNFFIFTIFIVVALGAMRPAAIKTRHWMVSAILALASGFAVYLNSSALSIAANISALMLFSAQSVLPGSSLIVSFFLSACTAGGAYVFMIIDFFERRSSKQAVDAPPKEKRNAGRMWATIVAILIVIVFFALYRGSNVLFKELTKHINLDWISWKWCVFTTIGAVVVYGILYVRKIGGIGEGSEQYDRTLKPKEQDGAAPGWFDSLMQEETERYLATLLLVLLNIMVLFVNGGDLLFMLGEQSLPEGITYTSYVHQGVGLLVINVLLAMLLVLYFFRGRLNFNKGYKLLTILAVVWLLQNVAMLFFTAARNNLYTEMFGMTYKRIGVYFYLLLTAIGVLTTVVKVMQKRTNTWLFRINTWLFFSVFVFSSLVSWSRFITWYSLYKSDYVNRAYLSSMSYQSLPYLVDLNLHPEKFSQKELNEDYDTSDDVVHMVDLMMSRNWGRKTEYSVRLYRRIYDHLGSTRNTDWRSSVYHSDRVADELKAMKQFGKDKVLFLEYCETNSIYYYQGFANIERIEFGHSNLTQVGELGRYPNLQEADLSYNLLDSLNGIEKCQKLQWLNIRGNEIHDFSPLLKMPNLKTVQVPNPNDSRLDALKKARPDLIIE
ncbi:MAG: DUF4173 domain-containing protein [Bacteroidia bacterium]|nr:DUF4173 domain-containing protein [Bacteroidia bacterium]